MKNHRHHETYCPRLWNQFTINEDGNVYSCCHLQPARLGNIYQETLSDICNNERIRTFRQQSLTRQLRCFRNCTLLRPEERQETRPSGTTIAYRDLKRLRLIFSEACNIRCVMCSQNHVSKVCLDYERLLENVDISAFKQIEIHGGEPLFTASAKKYFDYCISRRTPVSLLTNGLIMTTEWAEKIARHSTFIYYSLNAATKATHECINRGSTWEKVLENIKKVRDARERFHTQLKIRGHMTIIPYNIGEIPAFIRQSQEFGFDIVEFGFDPCIPRYLAIHPLKKRRLKRHIAEAVAQCADHSVIDPHRLEILGLL